MADSIFRDCRIIGGERLNKIVSPEAAAAMIPDHCCIWLAAGGGGINEPARLLKAIEKEFETKGHPAGVTLCHNAGIGDKKGGGVDRFAHEGMVKRVIGSHWTWSVEMQKLAAEEKIDVFKTFSEKDILGEMKSEKPVREKKEKK